MRIKILSVFLVFLISISITGCLNRNNSLNSSNNTSTSNNKISDTSVPDSSSSTSKDENTKTQTLSNNSAVEAYKAVMLDKAEFYSTDNKKNLHLNDFLTNQELYGTVFKVTRFTVLDMDGDKVPEVVLELSVGGEPEFYEVLHYMNGIVYGYLIVYRGLEELKADGTFLFSSGAADNGWGKLTFGSKALKTDILGYSKSSQGDSTLNIAYFINNKPVTKESFNSFTKEQSGKKDAVWYEFSQKNIENNGELPTN